MWDAERPDDSPEDRVKIADGNENDGDAAQTAAIVMGRAYLAMERNG
jgi:hypothetical protein